MTNALTLGIGTLWKNMAKIMDKESFSKTLFNAVKASLNGEHSDLLDEISKEIKVAYVMHDTQESFEEIGFLLWEQVNCTQVPFEAVTPHETEAAVNDAEESPVQEELPFEDDTKDGEDLLETENSIERPAREYSKEYSLHGEVITIVGTSKDQFVRNYVGTMKERRDSGDSLPDDVEGQPTAQFESIADGIWETLIAPQPEETFVPKAKKNTDFGRI